jgi:two-component system cell cycle sensor histidine kinase/response regulator CckA
MVMAATHGTGRVVLLADDDPGIRRTLSRLLTKRGHTVIEAADGIEALEAYRAHENEIDVVLTDVVMPRMNGRELAERLAKSYPNTPVIFMSGYTDDSVLREQIASTSTRFLHKPLNLPLLLDYISTAH